MGLSFHFLVFVQPFVNCCLEIFVLTGSDVDVMLVCVALKCILWGTQGFVLFGLFVVSPCDECVFAGRNVFLGPTIHLPRPKRYFESLRLRLIHLVHYCFQMRFQKSINPYVSPFFRIWCNTGRISSRRRDNWHKCQFKLGSNNSINSGQNCILDYIFNRINNITHFLVNTFIKTSFRSFHTHHIFINH